MIHIALLMVFLYYYIFLIYYKHLMPAQKPTRIQTLLSLIIIATSYIFLDITNMLWLRIPVITITMIIGIRFSTGMNWLQAFYGGSFCMLSSYSFRGIFVAIGSFIFHNHNFLSDADAYYSVTIFAIPFSLFFFWFLRKTLLPDNKIKTFLDNNSQLKLVIAYEIAATGNIAIINSGRYLSPHNVWYMEIVLGACLLSISMLIYAIYHSIRSIELLEYQWRNQMLEEQYKRQLSHYKSYQKYAESFLTFKHDYKSMMTSLKSLLRANDNEKALQLIDDIYNHMQKKVQVHKKYSDNIVLDAMLQDLANICEEKEIRFSFKVVIPRNTKLSLLDAIRIFSNITQNAVEACQKVPPTERFIDITSKNDQHWSTLEVTNSYNGEMVLEDGEFITTKVEKQKHGLGLSIVKKVVGKLGGFMIYDADQKNKLFLIRVHIPQIDNNTQLFIP